MASIAGIDLQLADRQFNTGGVFQLSGPSRSDGQILLPDGHFALFRQNQEFVLIRLRQGVRRDRLLVQAHDAAQRALDVFSVMPHGDDLTIPDAHQEHFLWWRRSGRTTLQYTARVHQTVSILVTATVIRADGTIETTPSAPAWHPAFRYFRLSQTTDDLYDSYRNMYLAFESVLSVVDPKLHGDTEESWLQRALTILDIALNLMPYVTPGSTDPVRSIMREQYRAYRCALFHAKMGQGPILPGSLQERAQVGTALARLGQLVNHAIRHFLCSQRGSGVVTIYGFGQMIQGIRRAGLTIAVSDDDTPASTDQKRVSPAGLAVLDLPTQYAGVVDGVGFEHAFLGRMDVQQISVDAINSFAALVGGIVYARGNTPRLVLDGIDTFEINLVLSMSNRGEAKQRFVF